MVTQLLVEQQTKTASQITRFTLYHPVDLTSKFFLSLTAAYAAILR